MSYKFYIGIDPSINHTGLVILDEDRQILFHRKFITTGDSIQQKIERLRNQYKDVFIYYKLSRCNPKNTIIAIEQPGKFSTFKGVQSAEREDLIKLSAAFGALICLAYNQTRNIILVKPIKWKGQVPKKITKARMEKRYPGIEDYSEDEIDALGIADWLYETTRDQSVSSGKSANAADSHKAENLQ